MTNRLSKDTVTEGSILVLPAYPATMTLVGLIFIFQSPQRTASPAFQVAKWMLQWTPNPIATWGIVFLTLAGAEWAALLLLKARTLYRWLLVVGCGLATMWAALLLLSSLQDQFVSFTGAVWVGLGAYAHVASIRSLARDVVIK